MTVSTFTIFGVQRSGTNFCETLINENFENLSDLKYVWKHSPDVNEIQEVYQRLEMKDHLHIVVVKNPYKWIESIKRNPVDIVATIKGMKNINLLSKAEILNCNKEFQWSQQNLLRPKEWYVEQLPIPQLIYLYNNFYKNWLSMKSRIKYWGIVRYEALLSIENASSFLDNMSHAFGLKPKLDGNWTYPVKVDMSQSWEPIRKQKTQDYVDQHEIKTLTDEQIQIIHDNLDMKLLEKLGYQTTKPKSLLN